ISTMPVGLHALAHGQHGPPHRTHLAMKSSVPGIHSNCRYGVKPIARHPESEGHPQGVGLAPLRRPQEVKRQEEKGVFKTDGRLRAG
ncbi:hypothetical protein, partial [Pyrobaculum sp.]|uniref:hypothetical protein n=1 Tax=Pyrobaculum sp. TaxID=2004705 RepID=UPI00317FBA71